MKNKSRSKFKWKKLVIILIIIAAIIVAAICLLKKKFVQPEITQNPIQLEQVERKDLSDFISLTGSVTGESKMNYSSSAASEILTMEVKVGDEVKEGDILATLDKKAIEAQIHSIEKGISSAAAVNKNQSKLNQRALKSAKEERKTQLKQAKKGITKAEDEYATAKKNLQDLQKQLSSQEVKLQETTKKLQDAEAAEKQKAEKENSNKQESGESEDGGENQNVNETSSVNAADSSVIKEEKAAIESKIEELKEQIKMAKESVKTAKYGVEDAKATYKSTKKSADEAVFSAKNTIEMEDYGENEDSSTQKELEELRNQLSDCTIKSKWAGIVTSVNAAAGDLNTPGTALITVENDKSMVMTASVEEKDILKLKEGMKAVITAGALEEQEIQGVVTKVVKVFNGSSSYPSGTEEGEVSAETPTGGFSVQIQLEPSELLSGMTAKAKIILTDQTDILCVPYDLVRQDENGQSYVLCAEDNGDGNYKAVRRDIQTGQEVNYYMEVTGGDISEGDYVILDYEIEEGTVFQADTSFGDAGETESVTIE